MNLDTVRAHRHRAARCLPAHGAAGATARRQRRLQEAAGPTISLLSASYPSAERGRARRPPGTHPNEAITSVISCFSIARGVGYSYLRQQQQCEDSRGSGSNRNRRDRQQSK